MISKAVMYAGALANGWRDEGWRIMLRVPGRLRREFFGQEGQTSGKQPLLSATVVRAGGWSAEEITDLNEIARNSTQDWLAFVPAQAESEPHMLNYLIQHANENPHAAIVYADEDGPVAGTLARYPIFKPAFNPEMLLAYNYIGSPVVIRRKSFLELGGLRAKFGAAADHDLWLRAWAAGLNFLRLPMTLVHHKAPIKRTPRDVMLKAVAAFCEENRPELSASAGLVETTAQIGRSFVDYPDVTLVIPTCQSPLGDMAGPNEDPTKPHILCLLESLRESSWPMDRLHVLIADDKENGDSYLVRNWNFHCRRVFMSWPDNQPFNYARKMNQAWREADTEAIVLMNDDVRVRSPNWLEALLTFSMDSDVGGVGARLVFPDGRVQHAGIAGGLYGNVAHAWFRSAPEEPTYENWALIHRGWSMVTGAVFATRRSVLEQVGGFDQRLALEFNDLDLCLRLCLLGYRIVYSPHAELVHFEKASRGLAGTPGHELARFRRRWRAIIEDDPAYHPGLSRDDYKIRVATTRNDVWTRRPWRQ